MGAELWAGAIAAAVTAFGGVIVALIQLRKENREDHGRVMSKLDNVGSKLDDVKTKVDSVEVKVDMIESKVDRHDGWHEGRGDFTKTA